MKLKTITLSIYALPLLFMIASCDNSDRSILVDGSEFPPLPASAVKEPYEHKPDMVKITVNNAQGGITEQGDYYRGLRDGSWTEYHPNGFPKKIVSYVDGLKQGVWIEMDNRGQLLARGYYSNDLEHGRYIKYNRTRIKEELYYEVGKLQGVKKVFYDDGKIMEESSYKDDKLHGTSKWYDQNGNVTIEYEYDEGEWINKDQTSQQQQ